MSGMRGTHLRQEVCKGEKVAWPPSCLGSPSVWRRQQDSEGKYGARREFLSFLLSAWPNERTCPHIMYVFCIFILLVITVSLCVSLLYTIQGARLPFKTTVTVAGRELVKIKRRVPARLAEGFDGM